MPRKPRIHSPSAIYHVILRGNAKQDIFFDEGDRCRFYLLVQEATERFRCRVHAFCLMTNHVHMAVQVSDIPLSRIMQNITFRYTRWINWRQQRSGHLFQGRYKAVLVDENEYLLELIRYIHLNPVRAGMVNDLSSYQWSSHPAYCGQQPVPWLTTDWMLSQFSKKEREARQRYRAFVAEGLSEKHRPEFHGVSGSDSRILGDDSFADRVLRDVEERPLKLSLDQLIEAVNTVYGFSAGDFAGRTRQASEARGVAAWVALETGSCTLADLAKAAERDASSLSSAASRMQAKAKSWETLASRKRRVDAEIARLQA
jgi:REP element-mobilizing transposase RayT